MNNKKEMQAFGSMKRTILDTNIYGELAIDKDVGEIVDSIGGGSVTVYGLPIIRKELRDTPKSSIFEEKNLRITMLSIYDKLVKDHILEVTNNTIELAKEYDMTYKNLGGGKGQDKMATDLLIVACASLNNLDIVVSDDCHSLCSEKAVQSYKIVNDLRKLRTPNFLRYNEFKRWFS